MRNINFIRLQNFIAFNAKTHKKKNYMLNKLQALETEFEQLKTENGALKQILKDILDSTDVCSLCQRKGKPPHTCSLSTDCIQTLLDLYKK